MAAVNPHLHADGANPAAHHWIYGLVWGRWISFLVLSPTVGQGISFALHGACYGWPPADRN